MDAQKTYQKKNFGWNEKFAHLICLRETPSFLNHRIKMSNPSVTKLHDIAMIEKSIAEIRKSLKRQMGKL